MPQMMPINWIFFLFFFLCIFFMFIIMNYYIFNYKPLNKNTFLQKNNKNFIWKW